MRRTLVFLLLFFVSTGFSFGSSKDAETFANSLKGKLLTLHQPYKGLFVHYDSAGKPLDNPQLGIWTTDGSVEVQNVRVKSNKVVLDCTRLWVMFEGQAGEKRTLARTKTGFEITIDLNDADTLVAFEHALQAIFLQSGESQAEFVPAIWGPYLRGDEAVERYRCMAGLPSNLSSLPQQDASRLVSGCVPAPKESPDEKTAPKLPTIVRVSQGVAQGLLLKQAVPVYPTAARQARISGQVVMQAIITREGRIRDLFILKPAGAGLDESAVEAVSQWKYKPYMLMGKPVEVETQVIVNYTLR